jgi:hypothetical protein
MELKKSLANYLLGSFLNLRRPNSHVGVPETRTWACELNGGCYSLLIGMSLAASASAAPAAGGVVGLAAPAWAFLA